MLQWHVHHHVASYVGCKDMCAKENGSTWETFVVTVDKQRFALRYDTKQCKYATMTPAFRRFQQTVPDAARQEIMVAIERVAIGNTNKNNVLICPSELARLKNEAKIAERDKARVKKIEREVQDAYQSLIRATRSYGNFQREAD